MIVEQPTCSNNLSAFAAMYSIVEPITSCMGMIQDFLRPMDGMKVESTRGDHKSLREYG